MKRLPSEVTSEVTASTSIKHSQGSKDRVSSKLEQHQCLQQIFSPEQANYATCAWPCLDDACRLSSFFSQMYRCDDDQSKSKTTPSLQAAETPLDIGTFSGSFWCCKNKDLWSMIIWTIETVPSCAAPQNCFRQYLLASLQSRLVSGHLQPAYSLFFCDYANFHSIHWAGLIWESTSWSLVWTHLGVVLTHRACQLPRLTQQPIHIVSQPGRCIAGSIIKSPMFA